MLRRSILASALIVTLGLGLPGCSSTGRSASPRVALVVAGMQLNFAQELVEGFQTGVSQVSNLRPLVTGPQIVDGARQVQLFQQIAADKPGGICVFTLDPELFTAPLVSARRRGIPLIAVDNPPAPGAGIKLFIGNDNAQLGRMLADQVISKLPPDAEGDIVLGTSAPGTLVLDRRAQGMADEFARRLPRVRVLGPFDTKQAVDGNLAAWQLLTEANPQALAFVGTDDADGWNLATIRTETKAHRLAGAFDLDPRSLQAVKAGELLLVSPEHFAAGVIAGRLQAAHADSGKPLPEGWVEIAGLAVTRANVDQVTTRQASVLDRQAWFTPKTNRLIEHLHLRPMSQIG